MNPWTWVIPVVIAAGLCAAAAVLGIKSMNRLTELFSKKTKRTKAVRTKSKPRTRKEE